MNISKPPLLATALLPVSLFLPGVVFAKDAQVQNVQIQVREASQVCAPIQGEAKKHVLECIIFSDTTEEIATQIVAALKNPDTLAQVLANVNDVNGLDLQPRDLSQITINARSEIVQLDLCNPSGVPIVIDNTTLRSCSVGDKFQESEIGSMMTDLKKLPQLKIIEQMMKNRSSESFHTAIATLEPHVTVQSPFIHIAGVRIKAKELPRLIEHAEIGSVALLLLLLLLCLLYLYTRRSGNQKAAETIKDKVLKINSPPSYLSQNPYYSDIIAIGKVFNRLEKKRKAFRNHYEKFRMELLQKEVDVADVKNRFIDAVKALFREGEEIPEKVQASLDALWSEQ